MGRGIKGAVRILLVACLLALRCVDANVQDEDSYWVKRHDCAKTHCPQGRCHFENCENPTTCAGGLCTFINCESPTCDGGLCTFEKCKNPRCGGGKCQFYQTQTTLMHGFCDGGICTVDNEIISSNMADQLAY